MTVSRRQAVVVLAAAGVLGPLSLWLTSRGRGDGCRTTRAFPLQKTDAEWRTALPRGSLPDSPRSRHRAAPSRAR